MKLETSSKSINLVLKTRKIVSIANALKNKKFEEAFFTALRECEIEALSKIIFILAEDENGKNPFSGSEEVYDFIDEYKAEKNKTYVDIYNDIAKVINEEGFFNMKMTEKELEAKTNDLMSSVNLEDIIKSATEKATVNVMAEEFQGFKA